MMRTAPEISVEMFACIVDARVLEKRDVCVQSLKRQWWKNNAGNKQQQFSEQFLVFLFITFQLWPLGGFHLCGCGGDRQFVGIDIEHPADVQDFLKIEKGKQIGKKIPKNTCVVKTVSGILRNSLITLTIVARSLSYLMVGMMVMRLMNIIGCVIGELYFCEVQDVLTNLMPLVIW